MKKILFILFLFISASAYSQINYTLTWQNALAWNIKPTNSEATNTTNASAAIAFIIARGGGTLYFPYADSAYKVKITIPYVTFSNHHQLVSIRILGATPPEHNFGTQGASTLDTAGVIIKSNATSGSIITVADSSGVFSNVILYLENLEIRANPNPQVNGIDAGYAAQHVFSNLFVNSGIYNLQAVLPTHSTTGIITPIIGNGAMSILRNVTVSGFATGIQANEHTSGTDVNVVSCYWALRCKAGFHSMNIIRLGLYNNHYNFVGDGGISYLKIETANIEHSNLSDSVAWQNTVKDVADSLNYIHGLIFYLPTEAVSGLHNVFSKNGGTNLSTFSLDSAAFASTNKDNHYYISGASQSQVFNTDANQEQSFKWQVGGTNYFQLINNLSATKKDLQVYNYITSSAKLFFDTAGTTNIGGTAQVNADAGITITPAGLVGMGLTTPTHKFDLSGSTYPLAKITNTSSSSYAALDWANDAGAVAEIAKAGSGASGYKNLNASDLWVYTTSGNIGLLTEAGTINFAAGGSSSAQMTVQTSGVITLSNLAGTGSRAVLADASGNLSAPISDRNAKMNIHPYQNGLFAVMSINPYNFYYKKPYQHFGTTEQIGFIAQDVKNILPNSVYTNNNDGTMGYNELDLIPVLWKAVQEQQKEIEELQTQIKQLKRK